MTLRPSHRWRLFDHADRWKAALQWLSALPTKCPAADGARLVNCDSSQGELLPTGVTYARTYLFQTLRDVNLGSDFSPVLYSGSPDRFIGCIYSKHEAWQ